MPRIERTATAVWEGNLARGEGTLAAADSEAFAGLGFSLASRVGSPEGATSPEELLAAAHAGCFTMSLAGELGAAGSPPERIELRCRIVMDEIAGSGHQIVGSQIELRAEVAGLDAGRFAELVERADAGCPFSSLLRRAGATVAVEARLEGGPG